MIVSLLVLEVNKFNTLFKKMTVIQTCHIEHEQLCFCIIIKISLKFIADLPIITHN